MRTNVFKKIIILALMLIAASYGFYKYINKPHRNIASEKTAFALKASNLIEFMSDEKKAKLFADQVIEVKGIITHIENETVILDHKIQVNLEENTGSIIHKGLPVIIKGRCLGYDDLLEVVKIDQAAILTD